MTSTLEAALALAEDGWRVFPVGLDRKPCFAGWQEAATDDPETVRRYWADYPDANPAIALPRSVVVVDVDPRKGGDATFSSIREKLPATLAARTPRGGFHLYFGVPEGTDLGNYVDLLEGIDSKTRGGYVLAPGAPGYSWLDGPEEPAPAPDWLIELARKRRPDAVAPAASFLRLPDELQGPRAAALRALVADAWLPGQRHGAALAIAGFMHRAGFDWSRVEELLRSLPESDDGIDETLRSAREAWAAGDGAAGYGWLSKHLPAGVLPELGRIGQNPANPLSKSDDDASARVLSGDASLLEFEALLESMPRERRYFPTGLAAFDQLLMSGAGLAERRPVVLAGAPEAAKTQIAYQIAEHAARVHGVSVLHVAIDEAPEELVVREAATWFPGLTRTEAASPDESLRAALVARRRGFLGAYRYSVSPYLEDALARIPELRAASPVGAVMVVVDSIHKVTMRGLEASNEYERLDAVCRAVRLASTSREHECLFVGTAELSRGAYTDRGRAGAEDEMGAAAGNRAIEYLAAVLALLRRKDVGAYGGTKVKLVKNKLGPAGHFVLAREGVDCPRMGAAPEGSAGTPKELSVQAQVLGILASGPVRKSEGPEGVNWRDGLRQAMAERFGAAPSPGELSKALRDLKDLGQIWVAPNGATVNITAKGSAIVGDPFGFGSGFGGEK